MASLPSSLGPKLGEAALALADCADLGGVMSCLGLELEKKMESLMKMRIDQKQEVGSFQLLPLWGEPRKQYLLLKVVSQLDSTVHKPP